MYTYHVFVKLSNDLIFSRDKTQLKRDKHKSRDKQINIHVNSLRIVFRHLRTEGRAPTQSNPLRRYLREQNLHHKGILSRIKKFTALNR